MRQYYHARGLLGKGKLSADDGFVITAGNYTTQVDSTPPTARVNLISVGPIRRGLPNPTRL